MKIVVCIKQVPAVSELPWDPRTGGLRREKAPGMINPACRHALEAALELREAHGGHITAISMGPPEAEESLRQALALGADRAVLLSDRRLAGADTPATSYTLSLAVRAVCPGFDLLLLGSHTTDSETGQVGPHLAEELDLPSAINAQWLGLAGGLLRARRFCDGFLETLEMELPALVSVVPGCNTPREIPLGGLEAAFRGRNLMKMNAEDLRADLSHVGWAGSAGRTLRVYAPESARRGEALSGAPKKCVLELLERHGDMLAGFIKKDLGGHQ